MSASPSLACSIQQRIGVQWKQHNYSDVTVVVEGTSFQCHKLILGACSEFFHSLFRAPMKESQDDRVELHGVTKDTFSLILDLIYTGIDSLTSENVLDIWSGSDHLSIDFLITHCEDFVMENMTADNCFVFYSHALQHSSSRVESYFFHYARTHFENIKGCEWFCELSVDKVIKIVESDILVAQSEDSVAEAVIKWLEYNPQTTLSQEATRVDGRSEHVTELLSVVRLYLVSPACLRRLSQYKCVLSCEKALEMIIEAIYYVLSLVDRHESWPVPAVHRLTSQKKHAVVFGKNDKVQIYYLDTGALREHSESPFSSSSALTVFDNTLYVCDKYASISMYTHEKSWETVLNRTDNRTYTISLLLPHNEYIYLAENTQYNPRYYSEAANFKRYNCSQGHTKQWEVLKEHIYPFDYLVRFRQYILFFSSNKKNVVTQCFDTTRLDYIEICPENSIEGIFTGMVSFSDNNDVFILLRSGQLWKIVSTDSSPVEFCRVSQLWNCDCGIYGAVLYRHKLVVFVNDDCAKGPKNGDCVTHVDGLCKEIQMVGILSDTRCWPIVVDHVTCPKKVEVDDS